MHPIIDFMLRIYVMYYDRLSKTNNDIVPRWNSLPCHVRKTTKYIQSSKKTAKGSNKRQTLVWMLSAQPGLLHWDKFWIVKNMSPIDQISRLGCRLDNTVKFCILHRENDWANICPLACPLGGLLLTSLVLLQRDRKLGGTLYLVFCARASKRHHTWHKCGLPALTVQPPIWRELLRYLRQTDRQTDRQTYRH